jgi:hypothetical protein
MTKVQLFFLLTKFLMLIKLKKGWRLITSDQPKYNILKITIKIISK